MRRSKADRLDALKKLLSDKEVGDQLEITREMSEKGYKVTQATISRDLLELGAARVAVRPGVHRYQIISDPNIADLKRRLEIAFRGSVEGMTIIDNLLLIRTLPGAAGGVGHAIDQIGFAEVAGSVAGDDTVLVICGSADGCAEVRGKLLPILGTRF